MGLVYGDKLTIRAEGCDAEEVVNKLKSLINSKFGEKDTASIGTGYDRTLSENLIKLPSIWDIFMGKNILGKK